MQQIEYHYHNRNHFRFYPTEFIVNKVVPNEMINYTIISPGNFKYDLTITIKYVDVQKCIIDYVSKSNNTNIYRKYSNYSFDLIKNHNEFNKLKKSVQKIINETCVI